MGSNKLPILREKDCGFSNSLVRLVANITCSLELLLLRVMVVDHSTHFLDSQIPYFEKYWMRRSDLRNAGCKSAITQPRQRLGAGAIGQLFHQLVRPMPTGETIGSFINKLRIVVIDGTCLDIPHIDEKSRVFGQERKSSRYKSHICLHLD